MLRILHTADWHLGAQTEGVPRDEDHARFLSWLARALDEHAVEVLVVAGDVFDQAHPSAEAQRLYFRFLHEIARRRPRKVVIVGGNHDSPSRLDAPRDVLAALDVHVVGGIASEADALERCVHPIALRRASLFSEPVAVVLAVPFVHEFRLGVRTALASAEEIARSFRERFSALYARLADAAAERVPGAPILATGHLACAGPDLERADAPADVHMIGTLGGLPSDIFDPRIAYAALGHIHRSYRVGKSRAFYPGSPVALSVREGRSPRRVLLVEVEEGQPLAEPRVVPIEVPTSRAVLELRGTPSELAERVRALEAPGDLAPLVYAVVEVERFAAGIEADLARAAEANRARAPRIVEVRQTLARAPDLEAAAMAPGVSLRDLEPEEVFERLCALRGEPADEALRAAFRGLLEEEAGAEPRHAPETPRARMAEVA